MKPYQQLFAELKRRNVFKVAWWYGIGIWLPEFDELRSHPIVQAHLRDIGLGDAAVRRTPPADRVTPVVLRIVTQGPET